MLFNLVLKVLTSWIYSTILPEKLMCFVISQASSRFSPSMNEGIRAFASARVFSKMSSKLEVLCSPVKGFTHTRCSRLSKALSVNLRGLWQNA